ncbi:MAG: MBL fold metallo-hydrolase [Acidimicrobiia bacterium]|nr:MBL fold metallo-hydrolase [Acidimicrobiia bacterium]
MSFYGVRGSTPCGCASNERYGGNTSCVVVEQRGSDPVVLDMGTGLRFFGEALPPDETFRGHALVTHLHWDHVQGLPFFPPLHRPGARLDVYGPPQESGSLADAFDGFVNPPYFPVSVRDLVGDVTFSELDEGEHAVGDAKVTVRRIPHIGPTNGYRVSFGEASMAFVPDHQQPHDGSLEVDPAVIELCSGVDLLVHDAQYTPEEFAQKSTWGHCTIEYALAVAAKAGARRLALFHHDPTHDDATLDRLLDEARHHPLAAHLEEVICAQEGLSVDLSGVTVPAGGQRPVGWSHE